MIPRNGMVVANAAATHVMEVIDMGCWTPVERFASSTSGDTAWYAAADPTSDYSRFLIMEGNQTIGEVQWSMLGRHNAENALAAILAARHAGVEVNAAIAALKDFEGVRRRMEVRGVVRDITVYDDFAHHPTAVATTIDGLRRRIGKARLIAVLEPRSNTMKLGTHRDAIAKSLSQADEVWMYQGPGVKWDVAGSVASLGARAQVATDIDALVENLNRVLQPGDHVLMMSNGGFGGIHAKLLARLAQQSSAS
jgi:UDP-N-acetylmuramate: L-alanyl-gamma-D-glutamyl-meso-diaminopimelate ligase